MSDVDKEDLRDLRNTLHELIERGFSGVHERLDKLNGRTRLNENQIASLQTLIDERDKQQARDPLARVIAGMTALVSAAGAAWAYFK